MGRQLQILQLELREGGECPGDVPFILHRVYLQQRPGAGSYVAQRSSACSVTRRKAGRAVQKRDPCARTTAKGEEQGRLSQEENGGPNRASRVKEGASGLEGRDGSMEQLPLVRCCLLQVLWGYPRKAEPGPQPECGAGRVQQHAVELSAPNRGQVLCGVTHHRPDVCQPEPP